MRKIFLSLLFFVLCIIPCAATEKNSVVIVKVIIKHSRYHAGMYNTGNYLRDLHRYHHAKKLQRKRSEYYHKYKHPKTKSYRPARSKSVRRILRIRRR